MAAGLPSRSLRKVYKELEEKSRLFSGLGRRQI
jgi:hypothetical protein